MDDPVIYDQNSDLQKESAAEFIPYFLSKMSCKRGENILDFGCGNGFVTREILLSELDNAFPDGSRKIRAVDISQRMVDFASNRYPHPRVTHKHCDIEKDADALPSFDKVFSFYVLQFVNQRNVFQKFYDVMKPNAELACIFPSKAHVFHIWQILGKNPLWANYHHDVNVNDILRRNMNALEPAAEVNEILKSIGFHVKESVELTKSFYYSNAEDFLAVCPFIGRIPPKLKKSYIDDISKELTHFYYPAPTEQFPCRIRTEIEIVVVRASKIEP